MAEAGLSVGKVIELSRSLGDSLLLKVTGRDHMEELVPMRDICQDVAGKELDDIQEDSSGFHHGKIATVRVDLRRKGKRRSSVSDLTQMPRLGPNSQLSHVYSASSAHDESYSRF